MSVDQVSFFLAVLAVGAEATVGAALALRLGGALSGQVRRMLDAAASALAPDALWLAFVVAAVATSGSLYLSEIAGFLPCTLCWYQRIAMYPLVPMLGLAAWRRDRGAIRYALTLAVTGGVISSYHVVLERNPSLESGVCDPTNPCTVIWIERFHYLTIPTMALSAFALILVLLLVGRSHEESR